MSLTFEIRRKDKAGLPLAVGEQRDDGSCFVIFAGQGHEAESIDHVVASCEGLSTTGVEVVWT